MDARDRATEVARRLAAAYPDAECELEFRSPWQLLVATMLSAQSTDRQVNQITPRLFARWPTPRALAVSVPVELEESIRPVGLHRAKARSLRAAAECIVTKHAGEVPASFAELVALPGVGPKTAKVVLGEAFSVAAGVVVDTHMRRLARRLALSDAGDAERVAGDLERLLAPDEWLGWSRRGVLHGRRVCTARSPACPQCVLTEVCPKVDVVD